jgi:hypothetical protein
MRYFSIVCLNKQSNDNFLAITFFHCRAPEEKDAFNRKHNRVGLPLGSKPISKKNEYRDTLESDPREIRDKQPCGFREIRECEEPRGYQEANKAQVVGEHMLVALLQHFEEHQARNLTNMDITSITASNI